MGKARWAAGTCDYTGGPCQALKLLPMHPLERIGGACLARIGQPKLTGRAVSSDAASTHKYHTPETISERPAAAQRTMRG